jgi:outer membrane biosynthesis protein TonB
MEKRARDVAVATATCAVSIAALATGLIVNAGHGTARSAARMPASHVSASPKISNTETPSRSERHASGTPEPMKVTPEAAASTAHPTTPTTMTPQETTSPEQPEPTRTTPEDTPTPRPEPTPTTPQETPTPERPEPLKHKRHTQHKRHEKAAREDMASTQGPGSERDSAGDGFDSEPRAHRGGYEGGGPLRGTAPSTGGRHHGEDRMDRPA